MASWTTKRAASLSEGPKSLATSAPGRPSLILSRACGRGQQADGGLLGEVADRDLFTAGRAQRTATRGVEPVSREWRSEVSGGRATVYAAACLEGALVVSFFVAVQLLLNKDYFSLSAAQHAAVYAPLCAAAVLAAFFALRGSRAAARGRVFRLGLCLSAAGRVVLIATVLGAVRHAAVFFPDLVIAGALSGAGFALVYSAATAFELDIDPARPERHLLRLTLTLAAGMAAGPLLQIGLVEAGLWWLFPLSATVLAVLLIALSSQSRLGPDAARSCVVSRPDERVPVRVKFYMPVALLTAGGVVICVAWSQAGLIGRDPDAISSWALGLGAFWAALAVAARASFEAIDLRASWRRTATLGLFCLPAIVTVAGLAIGRTEMTLVGIFLLATVACAALLPPMPQLTQQHLVVLQVAVGAGIIGIYPVAIALARPSLAGFLGTGATLPVIFAITDIAVIATYLICAGLIASRWSYPSADGRLLLAALPPLHARPCTAVDLPRRGTALHEHEHQPGDIHRMHRGAG